MEPCMPLKVVRLHRCKDPADPSGENFVMAQPGTQEICLKNILFATKIFNCISCWLVVRAGDGTGRGADLDGCPA